MMKKIDAINQASYMSPLPGLEPRKVVKCSTEAHPDAGWPLYIYDLHAGGESRIAIEVEEEKRSSL